METKIIRSKRKSISLSVDDELHVVVRAPYYASESEICAFVSSNKEWVLKAVERKKAFIERTDLPEEKITALIKQAKELIPQRVEYYSAVMNLYPTGVRITRAKKRFGSCSSKNSLCFSCFLMQYPLEAVDYVIVHELTHIRYCNHSREFYDLIARYMPDYKQREKFLKQK